MNSKMMSILSSDKKREIHESALLILEKTGLIIEEEDILDILLQAGASLAGEKRVTIPPSLVEDAVQKAPKKVVIYDRDGNEALILEGRRVFFGVHGDCPTLLDPIINERRPYRVNDANDIATVCDYLKNIDFVSQNGFAADIQEPRVIAPIIFKHMLENTTKPLGFSCYDTDTFEMVMEIAEAVAGGPERLRQRPFFYHYSEPTSPLVHSAPSLRRLRMAVERGIPLVYTPMPMAGATAPATLAGTIALALAETLTGVVIAQILCPGAPCIIGGITSVMDMKTTICPYGAPEMLIMVGALAEMAQHYRLPMFGTAGCSDAKRIDQQAAIEAAMSCLNASLSGANLVHDVGLINHAETVSAEMIVLTDEVIDMVKAYSKGIEVNNETLAQETIDSVGPGGSYLGEDHTLRNFRAVWYPRLFDRSMSNNNIPAESFEERLRRKTTDIMNNHTPKPLSDDVQRELNKIEKALLSRKYA